MSIEQFISVSLRRPKRRAKSTAPNGTFKPLENLFNRAVWLAQWLPYFPFFEDRQRLANKRSATNVIRLLHEKGIAPAMLVDCGANESQWAHWLNKKFPGLEIVSIEPNEQKRPLGTRLKLALGETDSAGVLETAGLRGGESTVTSCAEGNVPIRRFDSLNISIDAPAILKIDCETMSASALAGFGEGLQKFDVLVIEMFGNEQPARIWSTLLRAGFTHSRCVDASYWNGNVEFYDVAFWKYAH